MINEAHFTLAYWCVLVAAILPMACAGLAKWGTFTKPRKDGGFDNHNPRAWLAQQTDWRARANGAQANSFEALPFFLAAVIIAHQLGAAQTPLDLLCFLWLLLRTMFIITYVGDMPTIRSVLWLAAVLTNVWILFLGYR
jgi:uncharacterized MAPEG superfamily protein